MERTLLIVEDESKLAGLLRDYLVQDGFRVECVDNGLDAVPTMHGCRPDLILLDLMLPGRDGLEICREIRTFSSVPIIMITARVEEIDRILGLELGADDYICKPFSPREVVARVRAVLRRSPDGGVGEHHGLELDAARHSALVEGRPLDLTAIEFNLLQFLARHPGRIYGRQALMDQIYGDERVVSDRTIDSHIKKLRRKITLCRPDIELIHSVYGVGYKYEYARHCTELS